MHSQQPPRDWYDPGPPFDAESDARPQHQGLTRRMLRLVQPERANAAKPPQPSMQVAVQACMSPCVSKRPARQPSQRVVHSGRWQHLKVKRRYSCASVMTASSRANLYPMHFRGPAPARQHHQTVACAACDVWSDQMHSQYSRTKAHMNERFSAYQRVGRQTGAAFSPLGCLPRSALA